MKINATDYAAMQAAILARFSHQDLSAIAARYKSRSLSSERFRWDVLNASGFSIMPLYDAGLNDFHIDTALRHILKQAA